MSVLVKGMKMPYGCANCSFCSSPIYDARGYATYICNVDVEEVRGKNITDEVIAMYEGATESFPDWCPLAEVPEQKQEKWYPLGNWMPEKEVLAFNNKQGSYGYHEYLIGYIREDVESSTGFSCDNESEILMNVTHWMPLPDPPKQ